MAHERGDKKSARTCTTDFSLLRRGAKRRQNRFISKPARNLTTWTSGFKLIYFEGPTDSCLPHAGHFSPTLLGASAVGLAQTYQNPGAHHRLQGGQRPYAHGMRRRRADALGRWPLFITYNSHKKATGTGLALYRIDADEVGTTARTQRHACQPHGAPRNQPVHHRPLYHRSPASGASSRPSKITALRPPCGT